MAEEREVFDVEELLETISAIERKVAYPLHPVIEKFTFCVVCLGANVPNQKEYPKGGFCCGAVCDSFLPVVGICERFKLDRKRLEETAKMASDGHPKKKPHTWSTKA